MGKTEKGQSCPHGAAGCETVACFCAARPALLLVPTQPSQCCRPAPRAVHRGHAPPAAQGKKCLHLTEETMGVCYRFQVTGDPLPQMLEHSPRTLPHPSVHLGVITVVMGTTLHLVAESVSRRLYVIGCQLHHSVREKPDLKHVHPPAMVGTQLGLAHLFIPPITRPRPLWLRPHAG